MKNYWVRLRFWLIRKIAGNCAIVMNAGVVGGLDLSSGEPAMVVGNVIVGASSHGIYIKGDGGGSVIENNLITSCGWGHT